MYLTQIHSFHFVDCILWKKNQKPWQTHYWDWNAKEFDEYHEINKISSQWNEELARDHFGIHFCRSPPWLPSVTALSPKNDFIRLLQWKNLLNAAKKSKHKAEIFQTVAQKEIEPLRGPRRNVEKHGRPAQTF